MQRREHVRFGPFQLDLDSERLWQGAEAIGLRPKSFAVLRYLTEHPSRLITKDELLQAVWPGIVVSESALTVCLSELRRVLGDDPRAPQFVETVPRRGYRFIGAISRPEPWASAAAFDPRFRPPVVGRHVELAQLHGWWEDVQRGERRMVFVSGEPGIGKTTVVDAFVAQAAARGELWRGRGSALNTTVPARPTCRCWTRWPACVETRRVSASGPSSSSTLRPGWFRCPGSSAALIRKRCTAGPWVLPGAACCGNWPRPWRR